MAWVSKFSGLPTLTILPVAGDLYAAGTFTIGAGFPSFTRDWMVGLAFPPSSDESPIAYETLAGMSASIAQVLRVTARYASRSPTSGFSIGAGVALFGPGTDDAVGISSEENAPVSFPGDGTVFAAAIENDVHTSVAFTPIFAATPPHQFRLYWNGTGSAFIIPDAGFGSWSVPAGTVSYWRSLDDGTTWVREGDRAIAGGVAPTRVGIFFGSQPNQNQNDTVTFSTLEVMEDGVAGTAPVMGAVSPPDLTTGVQLLEPISVEITDADDDLDVATVEIDVNGARSWELDAPANGWVASKTAITNGYRYDLTEAPYPYPKNTSITVDVSADDVGANGPLVDSWSFTTSPDEAVKPAWANESPRAGSVAPTNTGITVDVVDGGSVGAAPQSGVDPHSVKLYVNDVLAWEKRAQQAGFTVVVSKIAKGYRYVITPDASFSPGRVNVRVQAEDLS